MTLKEMSQKPAMAALQKGMQTVRQQGAKSAQIVTQKPPPKRR
jgi:hypothetical protein